MSTAVAQIAANEFDTSSGVAADARRQIRGSSLLLIGRLLAKAVNFAVHVLIVRCLSQSDYGAFAYGLVFVKVGEQLGSFGLNRAVSRFLPIYDERQEYDHLFGLISLVVGAIVSIGALTALVVYLLQDVIATELIADRQAVGLMLVLVFLAPVEALDRMMVAMFAVFASPRSIFFRRYVLAPALKLTVVLLLMAGGFGVYFLACGYLVASALGVVIYTVVLVGVLRRRRVLQKFRWSTIRVPWREALRFSTPLLTVDLVYLLMQVSSVVMLGYFAGTEDVATFRAVLPAAKLNELIVGSFALLYTPQAARYFARRDTAALNRFYWQTAVWIAVMSFPLFVMTFALAGPLTPLLLGAEYESAGTCLALLSLGYYVQAAFGFNGKTLAVCNRVRYIACTNILVAAIAVTANWILIPRYGALGAAIATSGTLVLHNLFKQAGLLSGAGVNLFDRRYVRVYATVALATAALLVGQQAAGWPIFVTMPIAGASFVALLRFNRDLLDLSNTFPELMRLPLLPRLVGK